jgi:DNA-binding transcriptional LysR family regulator
MTLRKKSQETVLDLTLNQLHTILTIFECGSVTRAAEVLERSQPSLSRTLKEVESCVGSPVFDRTTRAYEPTEIGAVLIRHARSILAEMNHARVEIATVQSGLGKRVLVGVHPIAAASLIGQVAARFHDKFPDSELIVEEELTPRLLPELIRGHFDLLIATVPPEPVEGVIFDVLFKSTLGVFVRRQHPLAYQPESTFRSLVAFKWIYPMPYAPRYDIMRNLCNLHSVELPEVAMTTMSLTATRQAVLSNDWVVLTQRDLFLPDLQKGEIVELRIPDPLPALSVAVILRQASEPSEAVHCFIECLRAEAKRLHRIGPHAA